jgi:sodium-coupled neutral amino acid transporter 11
MKAQLLFVIIAASLTHASARSPSKWDSKLSSSPGIKKARQLNAATQLASKQESVTLNESTAAFLTRGGVKLTKKPKITGGNASIPDSVFNLVNNVAGAGLLTLSAGMAAGTGWIPAILICSFLGAISSHTFCLVGKACEMTDEVDFKGLWARTLGENTTYLVDSIIAIMCLAAAVIYSGILGDVFTPLLESVGLPDNFNGRTSNIIIITLVALLPMSLIKNLSALAFTSILGFCAIAYTVIFITIRSLDGTYALDAGKFVTDGLIAAPSFAKASLWGFGLSSLVLASNLSLAYVAHYNAPAYYRELKETSAKKFAGVVHFSFFALTAMYVITMLAGYGTFGDATQGNILLSYHPSDFLSTMGRVATGFSILFGFPLVAAGAREGIVGVMKGLGRPSPNHAGLVVSILTLVTLISTTIRDVSLVVGLTGAVMGSFIVYVVPVLIYIKTVGQVKGWDSAEYAQAKRNNMLLIPFGFATGALGVFMTIKGAMTK